MGNKVGRYSGYLRPITFLVDWFILVTLAFSFQFETEFWAYFSVFSIASWVLLALKTGYYEVYRFTKTLRVVSLSVTQYVVYILVVFFFFKVFSTKIYSAKEIFIYVGRIFLLIFFFKLSTYLILKKYRRFFGGNYRRTVIIGNTHKSNQLKEFFVANPEFGYKFMKQFSAKEINLETLPLQKCFDYIIQEDIDEIYCSTSNLKDANINAIIDFADNNLKVLKFLPDNRDIYAKRLKIDYYGYLPILSLRTIPIEEPLNLFSKRLFDIVLSSLIIVGVLSWLTPILAVLIKLESKGPVFFKQKRNGLDYKEFFCFKFRSMKPNPEADIHQVRKNDIRITKIGKLLRKTSLDELPQFFNVFLGEMSVVGPRPHMVSHTHMYAERIDKFMVRHFIKPGITGLAQVSGFRGEVESDHDIINRVKYDIFYLENWSILLDIKIIFLTIVNAIRGDRKAY
jgi:putative colanic acid biosynthesis UDP-glucose lipid carrier transferase